MTKAIIRSGHPVIGYDPVEDNVTAAGAQPAASAGEVTDRTDFVLLSLPEVQGRGTGGL